MDVQWEWFSFPFEDEEIVKKMGIAMLLGFASILVLPAFIFSGYMVRVMRLTIKEDKMELPPFDDIGTYLVDGFKLLALGVVYALPLFIIMSVLFGLMFLIPGFGALIAGDSPELVGGLTFITFILVGFGFLLIFPISLFISYFSQVALVRFVAEERLGAAFEFGDVWALGKAGFKHFIIAILLAFVLNFAVNLIIQILSITIILLCLLPFLMGPIILYLIAVQGVLLGKAYRATVASDDPAPMPAV